MSRCKYCSNGKDHILVEGVTNEVYVSNKTILACCGWCGAYTTVKINYCPVCGRKLDRKSKTKTEKETNIITDKELTVDEQLTIHEYIDEIVTSVINFKYNEKEKTMLQEIIKEQQKQIEDLERRLGELD